MSETHQLSVEGTPTLVVRNTAGSVTVRRGASGHVAVVVTKNVRGLFGGEGDLERTQVEISQAGNTVTIETRYRGSSGVKGVTVDLDIAAPAATNLDLKLAAGHISIREIAGTCAAVLTAGDLTAQDVTLAGSAQIDLNAGNLTLDGTLAAGASLTVSVTAGNVGLTLPQDTPAYLDARTTVGTIAVSGWQINRSRSLTQQQASGPLGTNAGGSLNVRVEAGNIQLSAR
jgi:hypothetical protein